MTPKVTSRKKIHSPQSSPTSKPSSVFHDHLTIREEIIADLDFPDISATDREELLEIIDEIIHQNVLHIILKHLPKHHHEEFLNHLLNRPHDPAILDFVKNKVTVDIDEEIKSAASKIKKDIRSDIRKSRQS